MSAEPRDITPIETTHNGVRFRSRLEARWSVFFDEMGIEWLYEMEGYKLPSGWYVPDFYLPSCATFVEVRGHDGRFDWEDINDKAMELPVLPTAGGERGPALMVVGTMPATIPTEGDLGWLSFDSDGSSDHCGFGAWHKNKRPWWFGSGGIGPESPLIPTHDKYEWDDALSCYATARNYRFWSPT